MATNDGARRGGRPETAPVHETLLLEYRRALQASEDRFRILIEKNADGMVVLRRSGEICFVNPAAEALLGRGASELVGHLFGIPLTPAEAAEIDIPRGRDGCGVAEMRVTEITWGGEPAYLASLRDVTERKRTGEALRFLAEAGAQLAGSLDVDTTAATVARLAFLYLADWCLIDLVEEAGVLRRRAWRRGADGGEEPVEALQGRYPPDARGECGLPRALRTGQPETDNGASPGFQDTLALAPEHRAVLRRLGYRAALVVPLVARGRTLGALTLGSAGGARRSYGAADLALAQDLAHRAALAIDNARLHDETVQAVRCRDEFLALLGHELRNPLVAILSAAQVVRCRKADDPVLRHARDVIDRQSRHMGHLLDSLLDISRITHGKIELRREVTDLRRVLDDAVQASRPLLDGRRQRLEVALPDGPLWLDADPTRLGQVVTNLLSNAAKYTPEGGHITLAAGRAGGEVVLRVRDNGIGIAPDMLGRVFEPFVQLNATSNRSEGGLGMGLTLVRGLVELHGGTVAAHSDGPGRGSEFVVRLPAGAVPADALPPADEAAEAPAGRRILLVEDSADARGMLRALLEMWGHRVEEAEDGRAGLERLRSWRPEVALVDIDLPGMSGYEVARAARAGGADGCLLVALTGYGQPEDRRRALEAGFDAHLVKPLDLDELNHLLAGAEGRGR